MDEIKALAKNAVSTDVRVNHACVALTVAKQLYALARYTLHEQLVTNHGRSEEDDEVEKFLVEAMRAKAEEPFSRDNLLDGVRSVLLPFVSDEIEIELRSETAVEQSKKTSAVLYKEFGVLELMCSGKSEVVDPGDTILIFGDVLPAVATAADHLDHMSSVRVTSGRSPFRVLDLLACGQGFSDVLSKKGTHQTMRVGFDAWSARLMSGRVDKALDDLSKYLTGSPDVLMLRDATILCGNDEKQTNEWISKLRKFCDRRRCALWIGIPRLDQTTNEDYEKYQEILEWPRRRLMTV